MFGTERRKSKLAGAAGQSNRQKAAGGTVARSKCESSFFLVLGPNGKDKEKEGIITVKLKEAKIG